MMKLRELLNGLDILETNAELDRWAAIASITPHGR